MRSEYLIVIGLALAKSTGIVVQLRQPRMSCATRRPRATTPSVRVQGFGRLAVACRSQKLASDSPRIRLCWPTTSSRTGRPNRLSTLWGRNRPFANWAAARRTSPLVRRHPGRLGDKSSLATGVPRNRRYRRGHSVGAYPSGGWMESNVALKRNDSLPLTMQLLAEGTVFRGTAGTPTASNCFTAIASLADGSLLTSWRAGSRKDSADGQVLLSRSTDGGRNWSPPEPFCAGPWVRQPVEVRYAPITVLGDGRLLAVVLCVDRSNPAFLFFIRLPRGCCRRAHGSASRVTAGGRGRTSASSRRRPRAVRWRLPAPCSCSTTAVSPVRSR